MSVDNKHPAYSANIEDWEVMRDTYRGERFIKDKGEKYLPATAGMHIDGMKSRDQAGMRAYLAYKGRAVFHDFVREAVEAAIGLLHSKPPTIELPKVMEPLLEKSTVHQEPLTQLLRRINEQQLVAGRVGLMADLPEKPDQANPLPYLALYIAETIINWDEGVRDIDSTPRLNLVVLNESGMERTSGFAWKSVRKHRVLVLGEPDVNEGQGEPGSYQQAVVKDNAFNKNLLVQPVIRGKALEDIPFVFINSKDVVPNPDDPPLLGLARLTLAIYRGEADYRQNLFMQGQDTLVIIGAPEDEDATRVGAGAQINVPLQGDAKFIGVSADGLGEMRQSIENDIRQAQHKAGQLMDNRSSDKESGDALTIRIAAQTATLNQIAVAGAAGLEKILKMVATWVGANPDEVKVIPNTDFVNDQLDGQDLVYLMTAKTTGAPISQKSIHEYMKKKSLTTMSFEEELEEIEAEKPLGGMGTDAGGNPDDDTDPNNSDDAPGSQGDAE